MRRALPIHPKKDKSNSSLVPGTMTGVQFLRTVVCGKAAVRRFSRFFLAALLLLLMTAVSQAACWEDSLARVDGDLLFMRSGAVYQLLDDPRAVAFWFPLSQITICEETGDVDGQLVGYYEIRSADGVGVVRAVAKP